MGLCVSVVSRRSVNDSGMVTRVTRVTGLPVGARTGAKEQPVFPRGLFSPSNLVDHRAAKVDVPLSCLSCGPRVTVLYVCVQVTVRVFPLGGSLLVVATRLSTVPQVHALSGRVSDESK